MVVETTEQNLTMSDLEIESENENSETQSDGDDCDESEFQRIFPNTFTITTEKALSLDKNYVLHISCTNDSTPQICAGLSNNTCELLSLTNCQINKTVTLNHSDNIINVKFSSDSNLLYTGSTKCVKLWDLRTPDKPTLEFFDNSDDLNEYKPLLHFDISQSNRLLCASTELYKGDAFLLFWDVRKNNLLGGYWESHTDDITKVSFHPTNNNKLASGSTDGLVNIYNLEETNEDDALLNSLNTDSTVEQILWYETNNQDSICCVTHTVEVQLWDTEEATPHKTFNRSQLTKAIKRKSPEHLYIANVHVTEPDSLFLLAGSNWHKGECVRGINIENNSNLIPNFKLVDNKQRIRSSWYNKQNNLLVTGGEENIISVWQQFNGEENKISLKTTNKKLKNRIVKPY